MTMKVKAIEKKLKFSKDPNDPGVYRYVMSPEQYSSLNQKKVIKEAALRSGVRQVSVPVFGTGFNAVFRRFACYFIFYLYFCTGINKSRYDSNTDECRTAP